MSEAYGYVHANTHLRTHLDKTYGRFYPISEGFLKLRIQMCVESNSHVSNVPNKFQFWKELYVVALLALRPPIRV